MGRALYPFECRDESALRPRGPGNPATDCRPLAGPLTQTLGPRRLEMSQDPAMRYPQWDYGALPDAQVRPCRQHDFTRRVPTLVRCVEAWRAQLAAPPRGLPDERQ